MTDNPFHTTALAGGYIPQLQLDHLSLIALHDGVSRSDVIRTLVLDCLLRNPMDKMIEGLSQQIYQHWCENKKTTLPAYLTDNVTPRLRRRKITKQHINAIVKRVTELNAQNEKQSKPK